MKKKAVIYIHGKGGNAEEAWIRFDNNGKRRALVPHGETNGVFECLDQKIDPDLQRKLCLM